ncbi:MAG TPA: hypothetical protein VF708_05530 [Pyrinomonadaceae bacterium]|jgi:hypothetical protein
MTDIDLIIKLAQIFVVPFTITVIFVLLRPYVKQMFERTAKSDAEPLSLEQIEEDEKIEISPKEFIKREILETPSNLSETTKEKLERLRLILEAQQIYQLIKYHKNSLGQSHISFWFSIGAATFGFIVILIGIVSVIFGSSLSSALINILSGAIIDAVAALFFAQSNQARRLMTDFFDKLRSDRQFNESLRLCEAIPDPQVKSMLMAQLSLFFAGMPSDSEFYKTIQTIKSPSSTTVEVEETALKKPENATSISK